VPDVPNFQEKMAKVSQVLNYLNENLFDFVVKKFRESRIGRVADRLAGGRP
jgi:hypothetical protein